MKTQKLIFQTVKEIEELSVFNDSNTKIEPTKKQQVTELLIDLKKFLLDKKADSRRKVEIILRMPLLQLTVHKA